MNCVKSICSRVLAAMEKVNPFKKKATEKEETEASSTVTENVPSSAPVPDTVQEPHATPVSAVRRKDTLGACILQCAANGSCFSADDISIFCEKKYKKSSISTVLKRLYDAGKLKRIRQGIYQIASATSAKSLSGGVKKHIIDLLTDAKIPMTFGQISESENLDRFSKTHVARVLRDLKKRKIVVQNSNRTYSIPGTESKSQYSSTFEQKLDQLVNSLHVVSRWRLAVLLQCGHNSVKYTEAYRKLVARQSIYAVYFGKLLVFFSAEAMEKRKQFLNTEIAVSWEEETVERKREYFLKWHQVTSPEEVAEKYNTTYQAVISFVYNNIITDEDNWNSWANCRFASVMFGKFKRTSEE